MTHNWRNTEIVQDVIFIIILTSIYHIHARMIFQELLINNNKVDNKPLATLLFT